MISSRGSLLVGGASRARTSQRIEGKTTLSTLHEGRILRQYDMRSGSIANPPSLEIDLTLTMPNTIAEALAVSPSASELAVASESGLVVVYRVAKSLSVQDSLSHAMVDLSLVEPMPSPVAEGQNMLYKFTQARKGAVSALCVSDIGFVAIGYESGHLILVDLRGPAIFYVNTCNSLEIKRKESIFKSTTPKMSQNASEYATAISILSLAVESRTSLIAVIGTDQGRAITFELLKEANGAFTAIMVNISSNATSSSVRSVLACNRFGEDLTATGSHLSSMHMDTDSEDCLMLVTDSEIISYLGLGSKHSASTLRTAAGVASAQLISMPQLDAVVVAVAFENSTIELFSVPDLRSLRTVALHAGQGLGSPRILTNGDVIFQEEHKTAFAVYNILGQGQKDSDVPMAAVFDALKQATITRPTISNWAWVTGTQYVRASDLDTLISGGDRPLSKRAAEKLAAEEKQRALIERQTASRDKVANRVIQQNARNAGGNDRSSGRNTYGQMQAYGQERGERVSHVNDIYENVSKASGEWLTEIDKLASNAKKSAGKAALKSFLGF